jgi:hypothetical protein
MKPDTLVPKLWALPEAIRQRLGREPGPQRAMLEEGHLLIILHELPEPGLRGRKALLFWRKPEGEWLTNQSGNGLTGLNAHLKAFDDKLATLDEEEERAMTAAEYHLILEALGPLLRTARGLHRALQQAREMVKSERELINLRDQAAGIERTAELLLQDAEFGLNFTVARQAEQQAATARQMAKTAHRLNLLAAMFLPVTALASVFGMNFESGLTGSVSMFWSVCAVGLGAGLVLAVALRKE